MLCCQGGGVGVSVGSGGPGLGARDRGGGLKRCVGLEKSRAEPGTGLGLSLVQAVARMHGGEIGLADSAPGLRVVLTVPKRPSAR